MDASGFVVVFIGLAATVAGMALPSAYPNAPRILWQALFWVGIGGTLWGLVYLVIGGQAVSQAAGTTTFLVGLLALAGKIVWDMTLNFFPVERISPAPIPEWKGLMEAIDAFCDPELILRRNKYANTLETARERSYEIEKEMRELYNAVPGGGFNDRPEALGKYNGLRDRLERYSTLSGHAESGLRDTWGELREDIGQQLTLGALIAQGFAEPYVGGSVETPIKPSEWRMLTISPVEGTAIRKTDLSVVYSGVQIAQAISAS